MRSFQKGEKEMNKLDRKASALLAKNRRTATHNGRTYIYTVPSPKTFPFQWFWDSCFHAMVYAALGEVEHAKNEMESLLSWQQEDGSIPHVIFWDQSKVRRFPRRWHLLESHGGISSFFPWAPKPKHTALMQPPVLAEALDRIAKAGGDPRWFAEVLPKANRYYQHLLDVRDPDRDGLISIVAPFESGLDYSPAYDPVLNLKPNSPLFVLAFAPRIVTLSNKIRFGNDIPRILAKGRFHVEDVFVNGLLAHNLQILAELNKQAGNPYEHWIASALKTSESLLGKCYDKERRAFFNLSGRNERRFPVLSIHCFIPLLAPYMPVQIARDVIEAHLLNDKEFWPPYPVPSVSMSESSFTAAPRYFLRGDLIWRGGSWVNTNRYCAIILERYGYNGQADFLRRKTRMAFLQNNFREYCNPITGEGYGAENFGWSTLVVDM